MAYSPADLNREVQLIIADRAAAGLLTSRGWLVTSVLLKHPIKRNRKSDPDDFSICCRQLAVAASVDRALAQLKHDETGDPDGIELELEIPKLPGFKHLRRVYPIRRKDVIWLIPLDQMSDEEIEAKIETYGKAISGFSSHIDELRRYLTGRKAAA